MKLKEILNNINLDELKLEYKEYYDEECKLNTKEEIIDKLSKDIIESFKEYVKTDLSLDDYQHIINISKGIDSYSDNDILYDNFFVIYNIDELDETEEPDEVVADEILEIIKSDFNNDRIIELIVNYISCYLVVAVIIDEKFIIDNFIVKYNLDITIDDIKSKLTDYYFKNDKISKIKLDDDFYELYESYNEYDYRFLNDSDLYEYLYFYNDFLKYIRSKIRDEEKFAEFIMLIFSIPSNDSIDPIKKYCTKRKIRFNDYDYILKNYNKLRFFLLKGRDNQDILLDQLKKDALEVTSLGDISFDKLSENNELLHTLYKDVKELDKLIFDSYKDNYRDYKYKIEYLQYKKVNYDNFNIKLICSGFLFVVKYNNDYYYLAPSEINKFNDEIDNENDKFNNKYKESYKVYLVISEYLKMNGVLRLDKIIDLLKHHDYELSKEDIVEYAKHFGFSYNDEYIFDNSLDDDLIDDIIFEKDKYTEYKICDINNSDELKYELEELIFDFDIDYKNIDDLIDTLVLYIKTLDFNKNVFNDILDFYEIVLNNEFKTKLYKFIQNNINDTPIWIYNGFTVNGVENN